MKTWLFENRASMKKAFFAALVISLTLAFTGLGIYFANVSEMSGNPGEVLVAVFTLSAFGASLLFATQLPFLGRNLFPWIATTLLTLGFLLWFQAHVLNWNFGELDGRSIPWKSWQPLGIIELVGYGVMIAVAIRFQRKLFEHLIPIACVLIFIQAVPVSLSAVKALVSSTSLQTVEQGIPVGAFQPSWKKYSFTPDGLFEFSQEENVVLIVLDGLGTKIFDDIQKEHPEEIGEIFRDFTCFTNMMCDKPGTIYNIPQILTGCLTEELPIDSLGSFLPVFQSKVFNQDGALLKTLSENRYRCDVHSWAPVTMYYSPHWITNIRPSHVDFSEKIPGGNALLQAGIPELTVLTLFRSTPILLKRKTTKNNWLLDNICTVLGQGSYQNRLSDDEIGALASSASHTSFAGQKALKFLHLQGAHYPHVMDENGMKSELFGIESEKRQGLGSLRVMRNILELMEESGVYDQSLIIVMSDHGSVYLSVETQLDFSSVMRSSFFIKRKQSRQSQMAYNANPVHISDTTPMILSELGLLQGEDAFSPFDMPESLVKERKHQWEKTWEKEKDIEKRPWLQLLALRPSQPLPTGRLISESEIQREDLSIQDGNLLQVDIRGDRIKSVMFDKSWETTVMLTPLDPPGDRVFVSEKAMSIVPFNEGQKVESWVCFQKLKLDTLPDGRYQIGIFFNKGSFSSQWKTSKTLSVTTGEKREKAFEIWPCRTMK